MIAYQASGGQRVIIKGSDLWTPAERAANRPAATSMRQDALRGIPTGAVRETVTLD